jgi:aspartyl protease family protein
MHRKAMIALASAIAAVAAGQAVLTLVPGVRASSAVLPPAAAPSPSPAAVAMGKDGHYWAQVQVNGQSVRMLVDTGATVVSLTAADARRVGLDPDALTYGLKVATAAGEARAARITLASVGVDGAVVRNVDALVLDRDTDASLLGMSYLRRLSGFEATPQALRLHP